MEKCWLIRTKNNHILGPISKNKLKDLLAKGTIRAEDELSSGNGYWFFAKEEEFVEKYINGDTTQGFNPVCEATPLAENQAKSGASQPAMSDASPMLTGEEVLPSDDDLEFPDMDSMDLDLPTVDVENPVTLSEEESLPSDDDLEFPDITSGPSSDSNLWEDKTPAPVQETPTPVQETPTPVQETPTPVQETPTPVQETPSSMPKMDEDSTGEIKVDTMLDSNSSNVVTMEEIRAKKLEFAAEGDGVLPTAAPQKFMASSNSDYQSESSEQIAVSSSSFFSEKKMVILGWIVFIVIAFVVYQRHQSIKDIIVDKISGGIISDADAQEVAPESIKKKSSLSN